MKDYEKSRKNYEQRKKSGDYDANMEYNKENDVESGAWVLITRRDMWVIPESRESKATDSDFDGTDLQE